MARLLRLLAFLATACGACAAAGSWNGVAITAWNGIAQTAWNGTGVSQAAAGGAPTYLTNQDFETTGYDNSETWVTAVGTPDPDYTATVIDTTGTQALFLDLTASAKRVRRDWTPNVGDTWVYFLLRLTGSAPAGNRRIVSLSPNGSATEHAFVELTSVSKLSVTTTGTSAVITTDALAYGTTYSVWFHYVKGAPSNAVATVGFSTTTTKPVSGTKFATTAAAGTSIADSGRIWLGIASSTSAASFIIDHVRVDDANIGDNPP